MARPDLRERFATMRTMKKMFEELIAAPAPDLSASVRVRAAQQIVEAKQVEAQVIRRLRCTCAQARSSSRSFVRESREREHDIYRVLSLPSGTFYRSR